MSELTDKLKKFTQDPDWKLVENLLTDYLNPLQDVMTIDTKKTNDEIASEVRGRQITISGLKQFLKTSTLLSSPITNNQTSFK